MSPPDTIVFDTEPLVAYADDEPGCDAVATHLEAVASGDSAGVLNLVNATEVRYILSRKYDRATADTFLDWLWTLGVTAVDAEAVWERASEYVIDHNPALGDSYALATAVSVEGILVIGGDDDYDGIDEVPIERFRDHGV